MNAVAPLPQFTLLQLSILELLDTVGSLDADEIQTRLCVASARRFDEALQGLKHAGAVVYRGAAADGAWSRPRKTAQRNPWAK
jgi:hypothetical protein